MDIGTLQVQSLSKRYGDAPILQDVSFSVKAGEVFTLLGPSGCGKSTTLRLIAGLERPDGGDILIRGHYVASVKQKVFLPAEKRNLGLVFQSYAIWPHLSVDENIAYPLRLRKVAEPEIRRRTDAVLELVGLPGFRGRRTTELSGGQQQRVALARALVYEPDILLLDEPLSNLDVKLREELRLQLKLLQKRIGTTILYVTHDQIEAMSLSHVVAVMNRGKIQQIGSPSQIYEDPNSLFVQDFVGRVVLLEGTATCKEGGLQITLSDESSVITIPAPPAAGAGRVTIAIRPEDILFGQSDRASGITIHGRIDNLVYCGASYQAEIAIGDTSFLLDIPKRSGLQIGERLPLHLNSERVKIWPAGA
jgi:ABC-type Fe3+/spermidine/putrescine transport system ATPase subunit